MALSLLPAGCSAVHPPYPSSYGPNESGAEPHGWAQIARSPLSSRQGASAAWVGGRYLVIGGTRTTQCSSGPCSASTTGALRDGAAFDPDTDQWTGIVSAPVPILGAQQAVLGADLYLLAPDQTDPRRTHFLRYDPAEDRWIRLPVPVARPGRLTAAPGYLIDAAITRTTTGTTDFAFHPETATWDPLPADSLVPSHDREVFWDDGDLVLFAEPGLTRNAPDAARIWSSRGWSTPATVPVLGTGAVLDHSAFVFPNRGEQQSSDGKTYPAGAIQQGRSWSPLPSTRLEPTTDSGVTQTFVLDGDVLHDGLLLDVEKDSYSRPPTFLGTTRMRSAAATDGSTLLVWGGTSRSSRRNLDDGYLLYP